MIIWNPPDPYDHVPEWNQEDNEMPEGLVEAGVFYSHTFDDTLQEYHYYTIFYPFKKILNQKIWLIPNGGDLLIRLLNHWNGKDDNYKYVTGWHPKGKELG